MDKRIAMLFAAALASAAGQVQAAELRDVTIALSSTAFVAASLPLAKQLGLFEKNGMNVKLMLADSGSAGVTALISGSAQGAQSAIGELVASQARGQRVVSVSDLYRGYSGSVILSASVAKGLGVPADAPVTQRLKALDGLLIAAPSATSGYTITLRKATEIAGVKVRLVYMAQPAMIAALQSGSIQGMIGAAPIWNPAVANGNGVLWVNGPAGEFPPESVSGSSTGLLMMEPTTQADRELVRQLRQVVKDLGTMITDHPDQVEAAAAKVYPDLDPKVLKLVLATELKNLIAGPFTLAEIQRDLDYVRGSGVDIPNLDKVKASSLLLSTDCCK